MIGGALYVFSLWQKSVKGERVEFNAPPDTIHVISEVESVKDEDD